MSRETFEAWFKSSFHPDKTGPYVKDQLFFAWQAATASLQAERDQLAAELKQSQIDAGCYKTGMEASNERLVEMAAECAALKESRQRLAEFIHDELDANYPLNMQIETPATDRFLAEQRAQGVEMFAVRKNKELFSLHPDTHAIGSIAAAMSAEVKELREFAAQLRNEVKV